MVNEPRFLLEKDSVCYGCEYYKYFLDVDDAYLIPVDSIDENGGVCGCHSMCYSGHLNTHKECN